MALRRLVLLALVLNAAATPAAARRPLRLYQPLSPSTASALTPTAAPWSLRILPNNAKPPVPGSRFIRVLIQREDSSKAADGYLLTVSGTSLKAKKPVSRQQDQPGFAEGQALDEADFRVDSPDCGPVRVVVALFKALEPLARAETTLGFDCGE